MKKRALITGITGQDGAYLAKLLLDKNYEVFGFSSRRVNQSYDNLDFFGITDKVKIIFGDITDQTSINHAVKTSRPNEVYNLAAMSFVGLSWQEPIHTANVNAGSSTVFVAGKAIARIGDSADAGAMTGGSSNIFAG